MTNYLENLSDGEIYRAYDIIGQILKNEEGGGSKGLVQLCAADVRRLRDASGRRIPAGVDRARVSREC
jgi:hypothetical protein